MRRDAWRGLVANNRSLGTKTKMAVLLVLALVFAFLVFTPLDLTVVNRHTFTFGVADILGPALVIAAFAAVILYLALMLLPGTLFDGALSLLLGLLVAGYLQGTFLNLRLGELTGDALSWERYAGHAAWNLGLWLVLLLLPLVLRYLAPKLWRGLLLFVPILILGMQGAALAASLSGYTFGEQPSAQAAVTTAGMLEVSAEDNILIFMVDRLDERFLRDALERDPAFLDDLDGFTYYPNHTSLYARTYPSVTYMLTGARTLFEEEPEAYYERAWRDEPMLTTLREEGYSTKMYGQASYLFGNPEKMAGLLDNVAFAERTVDGAGLMGPLLRLSAYRNAPHALKASLWTDTLEFTQYERYDLEGLEVFQENADDLFCRQLADQGLTVREGGYNFAYYHLSGCHGPFYLDEWTQRVEESSLYMQLRGEFNLISTYLDELKRLDLYDTATIIITGDHGAAASSTTNLQEAMATALLVKPWGSAGEMPVISEEPVSHAQLRATILEAAMLDYADYGVPYGQEQEEGAVREFLFQVTDGADGPAHFEAFEIHGDARDFGNWEKITEYLYDPDLYV